MRDRNGLRFLNRSRSSLAVSGGLSAGGLQNQLQRPIGGSRHAGRVDAALKTVGRIAAQSEFSRRPADQYRIEVSALQQNVFRLRTDFGILTAHNPGNGHRTDGVGNHQHL